MSKKSKQKYHQVKSKPIKAPKPEDMKPDWTHSCEVCGETPIVPLTGLCGPCTFGEAETAGGNW